MDTGLPTEDYVSGGVPIISGQVLSLSFTLPNDATDVTVSPYLGGIIEAGELSAYLTDQIGSGTGVEHLIAQNEIQIPYDGYKPGYQDLIHVSFLAAGTYFITLAPSTGESTGVSTGYINHQPATGGVGLWYYDNFDNNVSLTNPFNNPFAAGTDSNHLDFSLPFQVTGAVPEPSSVILLGIGSLLAVRSCRRGRS